MPPLDRLAVVIEPRSSLAGTVAEALHRRSYQVLLASTHAGAAGLVASHETVSFLIAAVPAPGEDGTGAYLEEARARNPRMGVVVMLSDPREAMDGTPAGAGLLYKPFDLLQLNTAITAATGVA
jgi:DNA-binding response OmpR family regulator